MGLTSPPSPHPQAGMICGQTPTEGSLCRAGMIVAHLCEVPLYTHPMLCPSWKEVLLTVIMVGRQMVQMFGGQPGSSFQD